MFKVPVRAENPRWRDEAGNRLPYFKVTFWQWLMTSFSKEKAAERKEWMRRRNAATRARADKAWADYKNHDGPGF